MLDLHNCMGFLENRECGSITFCFKLIDALLMFSGSGFA